MRFKTLLTSAVFVSVFFAPPALGATVRVTRSYPSSIYPSVVYEAAVGETNEMSVVGTTGGVFTITDLNAAITPETSECTSISANTVRCEVGPESRPFVKVLTKDGADSVDVTSIGGYHYSSFVDGGADSDTLSGNGALLGGAGADRLIGHAGGQDLLGGEGADSLDGGPGGDELEGGAGTDVIVGGFGKDTVSYNDHTAPVTISLDGQANDGAPGESDWIHADVESAYGSKGRTLFIGNSGPNEFYEFYGSSRVGDVVRTGAGNDSVVAGRGPDVVVGGSGDDYLDGDDGRDLLLGAPGDDALIGFMGADVVRGGRGNDILWGGWGADDLRGGSGDDYLRGQSHGDTLRGGRGHDRLFGNDGDDDLYSRDGSRDRVDGDLDRDRAHVDAVDRLFQIETLF